MIDQMASLNLSYLVELSQDSNNAFYQFDRLAQFLAREKCTYRDKNMPTLLKPNFISPKQTRTLQYAVENISSVLNKFISLYLRDAQVREIMKFSAIENESFFIEPNYSYPLVIDWPMKITPKYAG